MRGPGRPNAEHAAGRGDLFGRLHIILKIFVLSYSVKSIYSSTIFVSALSYRVSDHDGQGFFEKDSGGKQQPLFSIV
ncbi:hypothetical protein GCM10007968_08150 [Sporolactobacillus putidus]|uniref:Uncharacterized protein n=1 Tax=Sporolactobacillus putidus TaxID=492735 RepID=A0A917S097_9BACL|nr:hypothetical protein GCM10007968_08150 [Sporolactobacillus putidus]